MTSGQQARKDAQDEARRQQQAEEKVRELEKEVERLRSTLRAVRRGLDGIASATDEATTREDAVQGISEIDSALVEGGGPS
jgi:uncharacterized membrane protein